MGRNMDIVKEYKHQDAVERKNLDIVKEYKTINIKIERKNIDIVKDINIRIERKNIDIVKEYKHQDREKEQRYWEAI